MMMGIVSLIGGQSLFSQQKKDETTQVVKELIDGGSYTVDVIRALPMGGRSVNLTSSYSLEIKGDSVYSHLPYFGRAYSAPYGGGDGLHFEKPITDYTVSYDKKNKATIIFNSRSDDDNYRFNVQVFSNGSATIFVQPTNKQSITFHGDLRLEKAKE